MSVGPRREDPIAQQVIARQEREIAQLREALRAAERLGRRLAGFAHRYHMHVGWINPVLAVGHCETCRMIVDADAAGWLRARVASEPGGEE